MFIIPDLATMMLNASRAHRLERERLNTMTPEQRAAELREREVKALERLAAAAENKHTHTHHHFFS